MEHSSTPASLALLAALSFGLAGMAHAGRDSTSAPDGTEKSLGSSAPGSSGGGSGPVKPQGSALGGSTGDKGFSNVRENKGGKGSLGTMGGGTEAKAGHAGEGKGSGGTGKGDESKLDASTPADGSSTGIAK